MDKRILAPQETFAVDLATKNYVDTVIDSIETGLPSGAIVFWSGDIVDIPSGWTLCDGTSGTPDLRDRFVAAAGASYTVGDTGSGSIPIHAHTLSGHTHSIQSHTHTGPSHTHSIPSHTHSCPSHTHSWSDTSSSSGSHNHTATQKADVTSGEDTLFVSSTNSSVRIYTEYAGSHNHSVSGNTGYASGTTGAWSGGTGSGGTGNTGSWSGTSGTSGAGTTGAAGAGTKVIAKHYALAMIMKL